MDNKVTSGTTIYDNIKNLSACALYSDRSRRDVRSVLEDGVIQVSYLICFLTNWSFKESCEITALHTRNWSGFIHNLAPESTVA